MNLPLTPEELKQLKCGDKINISGVIYTARDAAHKKMTEAISLNKELPFPLKNSTIYYAGPCPAAPNEIIGSVGPTTSYRQDPYTPTLLDNGLKIMIGKGNRSKSVIDSMIKNKAVYLVAIGGAGLVVANAIKKVDVIGYEELGTEAIRRLEVENLELIVAIDIEGNNIYV